MGPFRVGASFGSRSFRRRQSHGSEPVLSRNHVYVVQGKDAVKLGVTSDLDGRLAQLQTGSPHRLDMVYSTRVAGDAYAVEAEAHAMLARHRLSGEWFGVPPDVAVAAINGAAFRLTASHGRGASPNWLKRVLLIALAFTPQWAFLSAGQPLGFAAGFFFGMTTMIVGLLKTEAAEGVGFVGFARWCGALMLGMAISIVAGLVLSATITSALADEDVPHTPANFVSHDGATFCQTKDQLAEYIKALKAHDMSWAFSIGCSRLIPDSRIVTLDTIEFGQNATAHAAHVRALNLEHFGETGYILVFDGR